MQGICHLSRRWHQYFCHSPVFAVQHERCLSRFITVRHYRQPRRTRRPLPQTLEQTPPEKATYSPFGIPYAVRDNDSHSDDLVVREFEQFGSDNSTRQRIEPGAELKMETEEVWSEVQRLDQELEIMREGPFGPRSNFMRVLPKDQREQLLKALEDEDDGQHAQEDMLDMAELERLFNEDDKSKNTQKDGLAVTLHVPRAHQALVNHFNKALAQSQQSEDDPLKSITLWKWYLRCQQKIPSFSNIVAENVWRYLWNSQHRLKVRPKHLVLLAQDMLRADHELSDQEWVEYIQALQSAGDLATALSVWEQQRPGLGQREGLLSEFYKVGVQLFAALGRPQKAQAVAQRALDKGANPKIMAEVVSAWAQDKSPSAPTRAWGAYVKLRTLLRNDMDPALYEQISDVLLDHRMNHMALAVFKDMIARMQGSQGMSLEQYTTALGGIEASKSPEEVEQAINQVSLATMLVLPKQYQNKFFFASWIKKLLGQGRTEAATMVVDLMYERNIAPDAIHLNGIIGAWLRDQSPSSQQKAKDLAQDMVNARIRMVEDREQNTQSRGFNSFRKVIPVKEPNNVWLVSTRSGRPAARANAETFGLLFDYYEHRHQWQEFEQLKQIMLGPAQTRPSTFIINKWLEAEIAARSLDRFWSTFYQWKNGVVFDIETWRLAWRASSMQQGLRYSVGEESKKMPSIRQLFSEMQGWAGRLAARHVRRAQKDCDAGVVAQIIQCFSHQSDIAGALCALRGLNHTFGALPDDRSVRLITGLVARSMPQQIGGQGGRRRMRDRLAENSTLLKDLADMIGTVEAKHKLGLIESGAATMAEVEDDESEVTKRMRLDVLIEFLAMIMGRLQKADENIGKTLRDVAKVMQVEVDDVVVE